MSESTEDAPVIFKSKKVRKQIRARVASPDGNDGVDTGESMKRQADLIEEDEQVVKAKKSKLKGVAFTPVSGPKITESEDDEMGEVGTEENEIVSLAGLNNGGIKRFAAPTGLMGDTVNVHMERYVASRLAKATPPPESGSEQTEEYGQINVPPDNRDNDTKMSTKRGKLMEVDLGDEARAKNLQKLELARQRLLAGETEPAGRRAEGIKRDRLVDDFLSENRLDVYTPTQPPPQDSPSHDGEEEDIGNDERVAEQFKRDFMEAMSSRVRRKRATKQAAVPAVNRPGAKKDDEVLRGPKLGGSRNDRAQMRDLLLAQQERRDVARKR